MYVEVGCVLNWQIRRVQLKSIRSITVVGLVCSCVFDSLNKLADTCVEQHS